MAGTAETHELGGDRGETRAAALSISNAMSRLHKHFVGRGPRHTRTIIEQDLVVCVLHGGLTTAEQTLRAHNRPDLIAAQRAGLQESMRQAMIAAVQDITGRGVASYMSADDLDAQLRAEIFVLEHEEQEPDERPPLSDCSADYAPKSW